MTKNNYLVPHDFSAAADTALNHALKVAKIANGKIHLLNVVAKPSQVEEVRGKLNAIAQAASKADGVEVEAVVRIGNIFEDIAEYAELIKAQLVFMGTHGAKGWQKISGSYAMKVIESIDAGIVVTVLPDNADKYLESVGHFL